MTAETGSVRERVARALHRLSCGDELEGRECRHHPTAYHTAEMLEADAALAAVADDPGLVEVLRGHARNGWTTSSVLFTCTCGWVGEHDRHAAHLADVIRVWLLERRT